MLIADDLPSLTRAVEKCKQKHAETTGERKAMLRRMQAKYEFETYADCEELYVKKLKKVHKLCDEYLKMKEDFEKKYGEYINANQ